MAAYEENGERNYYLQDELGSPLRIEDSAGILKESYGYGVFGEDLYQNQGKIQPFGYTGYQKDEIAGTYYAQAREYLAENGRFAGQDLIAGFMDMPFSMNRYSYCFNTPMILVDLDGAWPKWIKDIGATIDKGVQWVKKHKDDIFKVIGTTALVVGGVAITAATFGTGAGVFVATVATAGGTIGAIQNDRKGESIIDGFCDGAVTGTVGAMGIVINPEGAFLGGICQMTTDIVNGNVSSPESYAGALFGGALGVKNGSAFLGGSMATAMGEILESVNGIEQRPLLRILFDSFVTGGIAVGANRLAQVVLPFDVEYYIRSLLSENEKNIIETILGGSAIGGYWLLSKECEE